MALNMGILPKKWTDLINDQCIKFAETFNVPNVRAADMTKLNFNYITPCCNFTVPILKAETLWDNAIFNRNKKIVVVVSGWLTTFRSSFAKDVLQRAYMCRPDVNFVVVDTSSYLDMLYMWSVQNTNIIGDYISLGLKQLTDANPSAEIHLIGHSLGAHIMAFAARQYQNLTGRLVDRVTGLDPAKPCFKAQSRSDGKASDIARFVDVIHTNAGLLGEDSPVAHADFYPGGDDPIQNGCIFFECSHSRAIEYFAESVYPGQEQNFLASKCSSMENMRAKACSSSHSVMGYEVDKNATGIYYLEVNSKPPFGKHSTVDSDDVNKECKCLGVVC
ncbi:vitellogenin-2-like [Drosophila navojoa]|uniref:vitellogenin-2-like n=1 Tax=Drosophila navojoa TaxID=7232 RepID=UPI000846C1DC|nr:vitellogenin-2-like [Drosophila navojoa]